MNRKRIDSLRDQRYESQRKFRNLESRVDLIEVNALCEGDRVTLVNKTGFKGPFTGIVESVADGYIRMEAYSQNVAHIVYIDKRGCKVITGDEE